MHPPNHAIETERGMGNPVTTPIPYQEPVKSRRITPEREKEDEFHTAPRISPLPPNASNLFPHPIITRKTEKERTNTNRKKKKNRERKKNGIRSKRKYRIKN